MPRRGAGDDERLPSLAGQFAMARDARKTIGRNPREIADKDRRTFGGLRHLHARPGEILQWDSTAGDVLVLGTVSGRNLRMAVLSCMDVGSRMMADVVVIPREPRAIDLMTVLFRILMPREYSPVDPSGGGYRYLGMPSVIHDVREWAEPGLMHPNVDPHPFSAPAFYPSTLHSDGVGSNTAFMLREVLRYLQIGIEINRPANSTDGSLIERGQRSLIPAYEQLPGYTAGSLINRGKNLNLQGLMTAEQLQQHLRTYAFARYNMRAHSAHVFPVRDKVPHPEEPASPEALSPVAVVDTYLQGGGAIDLPHRPDLLYDLLPMARLKAGRFGLEFNNVRYAGDWLDEVLSVPEEDVVAEHRADFVDGRHVHIRYDPRDLTRIWVRHPATGEIRDVPWMMREHEYVPFSDDIAELVQSRTTLTATNEDEWNRFLAEAIHESMEEAGKQSRAPGHRGFQKRMDAAAHRFMTSRTDHQAIHAATGTAQRKEATMRNTNTEDHYPVWDEQ